MRRANGAWTVRHTETALGTVEVSAVTREAALAKMRDELRYRVELCPCSGVSDDYVQLQIREVSGLGETGPGRHS
jgi:hypothetical protein